MPAAAKIELPERYVVLGHIATGGMASVWQAEDQLLGRVVAVKVLAPQYTADDGAKARFAREARTAAQVSDHPHVVTIYDVGEHADHAYMVMEHFAGGTVAMRLRAARDRDERIDREDALRWLREAAAGLQVAHAAGIVHRDVKPANLLLDAHGRLAVGDFGIARLADDTQMTATGQVLGTAAYLSPEQALGHPATEASDRYALAVVAHELLTGSRPFTGTHPTAQARQHAEDPPPRASALVPGLSPAVDDVLARGLAKAPADRPARATAFVDELADALDEAPADAAPTAATRVHRPAPRAVVPPPPVGPPSPRPSPRPDPEPRGPAPRRPDRLLPIALGLLALLVVGGLVALLAGSGGDATDTSARGAATTSRAGAGSDRPRTAARSPQRTTPAPAAEPPAATQAPPATQQAPPAKAGGGDPAALNDRGFALSNAGRYAEAVAPLQAAVQGFRDQGRTDEITYAFSLFNLGVALNRSGNPAAAIPVLQERLKYANQRATVQRELDAARAAAGGGAAPGTSRRAKPGRGGKKGDDADG
jgi:serine/threonine-protein kinase